MRKILTLVTRILLSDLYNMSHVKVPIIPIGMILSDSQAVIPSSWEMSRMVRVVLMTSLLGL